MTHIVTEAEGISGLAPEVSFIADQTTTTSTHNQICQAVPRSP